MRYKKIYNYFSLEKDSRNIIEVSHFEKDKKIVISDEYKFLLSRITSFESIHLPFYIETPSATQKQHNYSWFTLYNFNEVKENLESLFFLEKESKKWYEGFCSYNSEGLIPIASISGDSDIDQLYMNCLEDDNGSIYALDSRIYCDLDENGHPLKIRVANNILDLIEKSEKMRYFMSPEFLEI